MVTGGVKLWMDETEVISFEKRLQHFSNNRSEDRIIEDYATRITEFYQFEIREFYNENKHIDDRDERKQKEGEWYKAVVRKFVVEFINYVASAEVDYSVSSMLGENAAIGVIPRWFREKIVIKVSANNFDIDTALALATISEMVYEDREKIVWMFDKWYGYKEYGKNYKNPVVITKDQWQSVILTADDHLIIGFRGTSNFYNVLDDIKVGYKKISIQNSSGVSNLKIHDGFYTAVDKLWFDPKGDQANIQKILKDYIKEHPQSKIYLTGHSLGGAMAALLYLKIFQLHHMDTDFRTFDIDIKNKVHIYTYGQPQWCSDASIHEIEGIFASHYYRIVNPNDKVPKLPEYVTWVFNRSYYAHCGVPVKIGGTKEEVMHEFRLSDVRIIPKMQLQQAVPDVEENIEGEEDVDVVNIQNNLSKRKVITIDNIETNKKAVSNLGAAHAISLYVEQLQIIMDSKQPEHHSDQTVLGGNIEESPI